MSLGVFELFEVFGNWFLIVDNEFLICEVNFKLYKDCSFGCVVVL